MKMKKSHNIPLIHTYLPDELPQYNTEAEYTAAGSVEYTTRGTASMSTTLTSPGPWQRAGKGKQKVKPGKGKQ